MLGFLDAAEQRTYTLHAPSGRLRPVVLPTYNGSRKEANLTPLLALMLQRFGIPVLVHGLIEGFGRVTTAQIFRELGIMPCPSLTQAQGLISSHGLAFLPLSALSPGLANQLALRARLGVRNSAHSLVKMIDPFKGDGMVICPANHPSYIEMMREVMQQRGGHALVLRGTEGEPFANPKRRPKLEYIRVGSSQVLFEAEHESIRSLPNLPDEADAKSTARWIRRVLDNQAPLPLPIANQLACCLYASGYAEDFNQAKAIVAVESSGMAMQP
jgi:anthranilate phosphoribosyltransferase